MARKTAPLRAPDAAKKDDIEPVEKHGAANDNPANSSYKPAPLSIVEIRDPRAAEDEARAYKRREQRRDRWKVFLEGLTLIGVLVYGGVAYRQWEAMLAANTNSETALEITQRAWIGIDEIKVVRTNVGNITPSDVQLQITLILRNFGHSLATDIRMNFDGAADEKHLAVVAERVCWDKSFPLPIRHISIFPDRTTPYAFGSMLPAERIKVLDKYPMPFMIGCFTYADPYNGLCTDKDRRECHWTRFCYRTRYDPNTDSKVVYDLWNDYNDAH
jgi:hypothetical protein